jgi:hypothetical protein
MRRLFRLGLAMALVIVVMRQAGDPGIYEPFFGPSEPDRPVAGATGDGPVPPGGPANRQAAAMFDIPDPAVLDTLYQAVDSLGEQNVGDLMVLVDAKLADTAVSSDNTQTSQAGGKPFQDDATGDVPAQEPLLPSLWVERLSSAIEQSAASAGLAENVGQTERVNLDWSTRESLWALRLAMDRWALGRVDQASVWKGADRLAFYRFMKVGPAIGSTAGSAPADRPARASVVSLLQQPDVYLHRSVTIDASVARAIPRKGTANPFGIDEYWELWLRPRDGSERPMVLFASEVSPTIRAVGPDGSLVDGPRISAEGVYLKRLAYRSAAGSELAPAIVGRAVALQPPAPVNILPRGADSNRPGGWILIALAAVVGSAVGLLVFVRSRQYGLRIRSLRRATQPSIIDAFHSNDDAMPQVDEGAGQGQKDQL